MISGSNVSEREGGGKGSLTGGVGRSSRGAKAVLPSSRGGGGGGRRVLSFVRASSRGGGGGGGSSDDDGSEGGSDANDDDAVRGPLGEDKSGAAGPALMAQQHLQVCVGFGSPVLIPTICTWLGLSSWAFLSVFVSVRQEALPRFVCRLAPRCGDNCAWSGVYGRAADFLAQRP